MPGHSVADSAVIERANTPGGAVGTVALVNSLGTTLSMWDEVTAELVRESFDVVRFDQRGHGSAARTGGAATIDDLVDDFIAVLDRLGLERVHVVGVSIGGMVAIRAASRKSARIRSLAVLCSAAVYDAHGWNERAAAVRKHGLERMVPLVMDRWFTREFQHRRPGIVREYARMLRAVPAEGYAAGCDVLATADVRDDLPMVTVPTLVVGGAEDPATPPREQLRIARSIPHARFEILPGVAHLAPVAAPGEIAKLVAENAMDQRQWRSGSRATERSGH
ncbi:alpha/beta fold hydrolase [Nocardia canadensis]|uniref:alpha/beta fold hydrolase n=1 Tax=Nocardia canadensis TaxID=3065238 RepID=UPI00292EBBDC|nr:alpha/beta fold hydrolase [Nocardia canadensis]